MNFKSKYDSYSNLVNAALEKYLPVRECHQKTIYEAMRYSLMAGGKRLRPVLSLAVCDMLGGDMEEILPYACALEMIHTYSLIHDDLPAMDNDDYRRGRLTNHKVYGEAMAILAGDALLNYAFELMLAAAGSSGKNPAGSIAAMRIIANSSGVSGMIGGQVIDMESEGKTIGPDLLDAMHSCKTGAIIKAAVLAPAALCGADDSLLKHLEEYSGSIGVAFQVKDDILDIEGNLGTLGKQCGSDEANDKSTFVTLYGMEKSKEMLDSLTKAALQSIEEFGDKAWFLRELAVYIAKRGN